MRILLLFLVIIAHFVDCSDPIDDDDSPIFPMPNTANYTVPPDSYYPNELFFDTCMSGPKRYIESPPITWTYSPLTRLPCSLPVTLDSLNDFMDLIDVLNQRIAASFPRMVYTREWDEAELRDFVLAAKLAAENALCDHRLVPTLNRNKSFRELIWNMKMMVEHVAFTGLSFEKAQNILASIAPWVHAFMHAHFYLGFETFDVFADAGWDFLNEVVKYHPQYTEDIDGVWYLRLERRAVVPPYDRISALIDRIPYMLDMPELDTIMEIVDIRITPVMTPNHLAEMLWNRLEWVFPCDDFGDSDALRAILFALKYMHEFETIGVGYEAIQALLQSIRSSPERQAILAEHWHGDFSPSTPSAAIGVFNEFIRPENLFELLRSLRLTETRGKHRIIRVNPATILEDSLRKFGSRSLSKYDLADSYGYFTFSGEYPGKSVGFFQDLLSQLFDPNRGHFTNVNGRYYLDPSNTVQYKVAIGRIMGKILKLENPHGILNDYLSPAPTVLETFFFNSMDVRSGFYDVFHDGMLERLFQNNGTRALEALFSMSS